MESKGRKILSAARVRVAKQMPYFRGVLFQLRPVEAKGLGTMGVDEKWRLYWDEKALTKWDVDGTAAVLIHEVMHVLRRHAERRGTRRPKEWNFACDAEINDDQPEDMPLPGDPILPAYFGLEAGLVAETYYAARPEDNNSQVGGSGGGECQEGEQEGQGGGDGGSGDGDADDGKDATGGEDGEPKAPGCGGSCGGCAGNPHAIESDEDEVEGVSDAVKEMARKIVAQEIVEAAKSQGTGLGNLEGWAKAELKPPTVSWQKRLANLVRGSLNYIAGRIDYTHRKPGRRYFAMRSRFGKRAPVSPSMQQPKPRVGCVLDVSGSMGGEIGQAMGEVLGLVRAAGGEVTVYAADMEIRTTVDVRDAKDLQRLDEGGGMGGTSIDKAIRQALEEKRHDLLVIITDGFTNWVRRDELKGVKCLAVITPQGRKAPEWMPQVRIGGENAA